MKNLIPATFSSLAIQTNALTSPHHQGIGNDYQRRFSLSNPKSYQGALSPYTPMSTAINSDRIKNIALFASSATENEKIPDLSHLKRAAQKVTSLINKMEDINDRQTNQKEKAFSVSKEIVDFLYGNPQAKMMSLEEEVADFVIGIVLFPLQLYAHAAVIWPIQTLTAMIEGAAHIAESIPDNIDKPIIRETLLNNLEKLHSLQSDLAKNDHLDGIVDQFNELTNIYDMRTSREIVSDTEDGKLLRSELVARINDINWSYDTNNPKN